tara:strand:- start:84391 stop:84729 length:339 start_codon:yes stop_codon:yes gene_type:complete
MGFFTKLKFWKKKDEFDFDKLVDKHETPTDNLGLNPPTGLEEKSPFDTPELQPAAPLTPPLEPAHEQFPSQPLKDIDLVNSKLDTIKALLTSMDQRLANLERGNQQEKQKLW